MTIMKHSKEKPPNWDKLKEVFKYAKWEEGIIVTYGDTCYCKYDIAPDLDAHEATHMRQQEKMGVEAWWDKYYNDPLFRLGEEIEAYKNQANYLKNNPNNMNREQRRERICAMAEALSSPIYGKIIKYKQALELIK